MRYLQQTLKSCNFSGKVFLKLRFALPYLYCVTLSNPYVFIDWVNADNDWQSCSAQLYTEVLVGANDNLPQRCFK